MTDADVTLGGTPHASDAIDVVIPVYNGASYIRDCVASVVSQTLTPRRIIVVDDGSTDETAEVVGALRRSNPIVTLHSMGTNSGVSAARNAGIRLSRSPFIAFIDADDVWLPNKLALQMQILSVRPAVGFVHASFFLIDQAGNVLPQTEGSPLLLSGNVFRKLLWEGNVLSGSASSVLIRRDVLDAAGLFDEQLYYGEDWDLWLRLAAISEVGHTPEAVVGVRIHKPGAVLSGRRGTDHFMQMLRVYARWEAPVRSESGLLQKLRKDGFLALLTHARNPREVYSFYRTLKASPQDLLRDLYRDQLHFWAGLSFTATQRVWMKAARLATGKAGQSPARFSRIR